MVPPPIDASEFEAHRDLNRIVADFLCRNSDKAYSVKEIAEATGMREEDINHSMLKLGFQDMLGSISSIIVRGKSWKDPNLGSTRIEDVTINGTIYYRCVKWNDRKSYQSKAS
jgi:hypothetical protein